MASAASTSADDRSASKFSTSLTATTAYTSQVYVPVVDRAGMPETPTEEPITPTTTVKATLSPTSTTEISPPVTVEQSTGVQVYTTTVTLPTYPFRDFLSEQIDPIYDIPVYYFDRSAYDAEPRQPVPVDYTGVVLENPYLRLTFLPELGGRLYSAMVKETNQEPFYHNPVVKPSRYGVLQPYEANWWLATGGMDWAYPTQEHGYRFGVPWDYEIMQTESGATITLSDTGPDRVGLEVKVTLPEDSAVFTVIPNLVNNSPDAAPIQLWTNAALTLGESSMSPNTQFIVPTEQITVHSRGESGWTVPGERESASWPQVGETDLRDYNQWTDYLGFFVPNQTAPFLAAYNPNTNLGMIRLPITTSFGSSKLFAFGQNFPDRSYTDDNSQYFEIWGGANAGFWPQDDISVPAGGSLGWEERWWPFAQLDGLTWATEHVAIYLDESGSSQTLSALFAQPTQGTLRVSNEATTLLNETFSVQPATPLQWEIPASESPLEIQFDENGSTLLVYKMD